MQTKPPSVILGFLFEGGAQPDGVVGVATYLITPACVSLLSNSAKSVFLFQ